MATLAYLLTLLGTLGKFDREDYGIERVFSAAAITQTKLQNRLRVEKLGRLVKMSICLASHQNCQPLPQLEEICDDDSLETDDDEDDEDDNVEDNENSNSEGLD